MPELEEQLAALATAIEWPRTPDLKVVLPIHGEVAGEAGRRGWRLPQSRWALAAAAVLLIVATLLAYTPTRNAIADWVNLHTVFHRSETPLPSPTPLPSGRPGQYLNLGTAVTLDEARHSGIEWKILLPASLGQPDAVYVKLPPDGPSGGAVSLVYGERSDIKPSGLTGVSVLVTEARGRVNEQFFQKTLGPDVTIEQVTIDGHSGYWISGRPHNFVFTAADGTPYFDTLRLATNTLVYDDGGTVVRIEGDLSKEQAIQIARSIS